MEEDTRGGSPCDDKKKNAHCTINIFCNEKKHDDMAGGHDDDGCVINIFCDDDEKHGHDSHKKNESNCTINIFCNDKKSDDKCDKEKW